MNRQVLVCCFGFHGTETQNNKLPLLLYSVRNLIYYIYIYIYIHMRDIYIYIYIYEGSSKSFRTFIFLWETVRAGGRV